MAYKTCKTCIHNRVCKYADEKVSLGTTVREIMHRCVDYKNKADFVNVTRCKDCKYCEHIRFRFEPDLYFCNNSASNKAGVKPDGFCSYGERRGEE